MQGAVAEALGAAGDRRAGMSFLPVCTPQKFTAAMGGFAILPRVSTAGWTCLGGRLFICPYDSAFVFFHSVFLTCYGHVEVQSNFLI